VPQTSSPSALSSGIPLDPSTSNMHGTGSTIGASVTGGWKSWALPRRLSDITWVRKAGLVEKETGNVLVWGAPNVDNIGSIRDRTKGPRLV
jgi:cytochrome c oxidase assembly factor 3